MHNDEWNELIDSPLNDKNFCQGFPKKQIQNKRRKNNNPFIKKLKSGVKNIIDNQLHPIKKIITNNKYKFDANIKRYSNENFIHQKRLFTFLGNEMNQVSQHFKDVKINFEDFENYLKWFSYREDIPNLVNSERKKFKSDASQSEFI